MQPHGVIMFRSHVSSRVPRPTLSGESGSGEMVNIMLSILQPLSPLAVCDWERDYA